MTPVGKGGSAIGQQLSSTQIQQHSTLSELWLKDELCNPLLLLVTARIMCVCGQGGLSWDVYFLVIVTRANLSLVISFCALEQ